MAEPYLLTPAGEGRVKQEGHLSDFTLQARQVRRTRLNICIQTADEHDFTTCWITVLGENEFVSNRSFLYMGRGGGFAEEEQGGTRKSIYFLDCIQRFCSSFSFYI